MSTRRYQVALVSLILGVLFIAMAAGYISSRRLLLSLGALALAGACLAIWAAVGKCWKPTPLEAQMPRRVRHAA